MKSLRVKHYFYHCLELMEKVLFSILKKVYSNRCNIQYTLSSRSILRFHCRRSYNYWWKRMKWENEYCTHNKNCKSHINSIMYLKTFLVSTYTFIFKLFLIHEFTSIVVLIKEDVGKIKALVHRYFMGWG